jgi:hypothetical protein
MVMSKKSGMKKPPHGDKYKHLAALKPPFQSSSAVLAPDAKTAKAKRASRQQEKNARSDEKQ